MLFLLSLIIALIPIATEMNANAAPAKYGYEVAPAQKQLLGTAFENSESASPLWFTLTGGMITELFYPSVTQPQLGELQFVVTDGQNFFSEQRRDTVSEAHYQDEGLLIEVNGRDSKGYYTYHQEIFADTAAPVLRIRTSFQWFAPGLRVYVIFKPTIQGNSEGNFGEAHLSGFTASALTPSGRTPIFASLLASVPWKRTSAEYENTFWKGFEMGRPEAGPGNILLMGELEKKEGHTFSFELALGFGSSEPAALTYAMTALMDPFDRGARAYAKGWQSYLQQLSSGPKSPGFIQGSLFARRSAQIIKMHEDKLKRGAIAPNLAAPLNSPEEPHLRQPPQLRVRDIYRGAIALLAAGDRITPIQSLQYLIQTQKEDGSWKSASQQKLALDEMAFPILLTAQLHQRGLIRLRTPETEMVRRATDFILSHGPATELDRWDSHPGFVPSTLAVEIAALRAATRLTGDPAPASFADRWQSQLENWTLVQRGPLGQNYYLSTRTHLPSDTLRTLEEEPLTTLENPLPSSIGPLSQEELIDGGFLNLVRYGVRDAHDPRVLNTLRIYENPSLGISKGLHYYRGTWDLQNTRGVSGQQAGLWPALAGERGIYSVMAGDFERARAELHALESTANENGLLPERIQAGLEVACPSVWAHAEDILLHRSIEERRVFDQPSRSLPD